ncbi:MAG: carbohydrate ABC transporter permease [Lachnospiraceae bacterium]|jgi:multiple sugar transport system permease protein|nr:carbohydrate ABC transporter permease [Lachnospiraceae bacterium]
MKRKKDIKSPQDKMDAYRRSAIVYKVFTVAFTLAAVVLAVVTLYPYFFSVIASLRKGFNIYSFRFKFSDLTPYAYERILFGLKDYETGITIWKWMLNSLILSASTTLLTLLFSSMGGYALARIEFAGKKAWFAAILAVMMIPGQITLVPKYIMIVRGLEWGNSYTGLIVPFLFSAYYTFMMRQFFLSFPKELEEAAIMDGMGRIGIFVKMLLPLSRAPLLAAGTLLFMGSWGSYLWPKLLLQKQEMYPISVGMTLMMNSKYKAAPSIPIAAAIITMLPLLILFIIFQRYFMESIANTGSKGA